MRKRGSEKEGKRERWVERQRGAEEEEVGGRDMEGEWEEQK